MVKMYVRAEVQTIPLLDGMSAEARAPAAVLVGCLRELLQIIQLQRHINFLEIR